MPGFEPERQRARRDTLIPLEQLLEEDLGAICDDLNDEFREMSASRLLVTGGGGFLGYYLVQSVLYWNRRQEAGARIDVTVYDNYLRGLPAWLEALRGEPGLELVRYDVTEPLPRGIPHFDWILHAAGIASPVYYRAKPIECMDANVDGVRNLLDYAVAEGGAGRPVKGLVFFSSSEIYGDPEPAAIPTPETYRGNVSCTGPRAPYDESKRFGETLCVTYARARDVPVRIVRPFNNYGPGLKISDGRVIPDFARDILAGRDLVMLSDGSPTRTYCYISDAVAGYYKALVCGSSGEAYNIGIDYPEISVAGLAQLMVDAAGRLFGYRGKVQRRRSAESNYLVDNPQRRCPAIGKAQRQLGYSPRVLAEEGIGRALTWYSHHRLGEDA